MFSGEVPVMAVKPARQDLGPAIPAADKAIENGSIEAKSFKPDDVAGGRELD